MNRIISALGLALAFGGCSNEAKTEVVEIPHPVAQDAGNNNAESDSSINVGYLCIPRPEIPYNAIDEDCNGNDITDIDRDSYDSILAGGTDCDDDDHRINPSAPEKCDGVDNNCNRQLDEGFNVGSICYAGQDSCRTEGVVVCIEDGTSQCTAKPQPTQEEVCDGLDNDCDGRADFIVSSLCENNSLDCLERKVLQTLPDRFADFHESFQLAAASTDGILAVWGEPRWNDEYYGRLFSFAGEPQSEEFPIELGFRYPDDFGEYPIGYGHPALFNIEDRILLLRDVGLKVFDHHGGNVGEHLPEISNEGGFYTSGSVMGSALIAIGYADLGRGQWDIFVEKFDKNGSMIQLRSPLAAELDERGVYPRVAANGQGYIVVWDSGHGNNAERIRMKLFDATGSATFSNIITEVPNGAYSPAYAVEALPDRYVVAWQNPESISELFVQQFNLQGEELCQRSILPHAGTGAEGTRIISNQSGAFLISWYHRLHNPSANGIYALQRFNKNGVPIGDMILYEQGPMVTFRQYAGSDNGFLRIDLEENELVLRRIPEE